MTGKRWVFVILVAVVSGVTGNALAGLLRGESRAVLRGTIRARVVLLEDETGTRRALLGVDAHGPQLSLYDENGERRVVLSVGAQGEGLKGRGRPLNLAGGLV